MRVRFCVSGLVQGVCYRATAQHEARRLGLQGWVRNRDDGDVEGVVDGDAQAVRGFLYWAARGPRGARVTHLDETVEADDTPLPAFEVRR